MRTTITLRCGAARSGRNVYEEVLVEQGDQSTYEVLASPGLVLGIAAGDTIRVENQDDFAVVARGGNVCIQVFRGAGVDILEPLSTREVAAIGGRLDGRTDRELVYTVGVSVGFAAIERAMARIMDGFSDCEWYYGNVYDPADGVTPLNWCM